MARPLELAGKDWVSAYDRNLVGQLHDAGVHPVGWGKANQRTPDCIEPFDAGWQRDLLGRREIDIAAKDQLIV